MVHMESSRGTAPIRRRRQYKKSLSGCRNCKLRKVKCDETKPKCRQCTSYGVVCNYVSNTPDLHVSAVGPYGRKSTRSLGPSANLQARQYEDEHLPSFLQSSLRPTIFCADGSCEFRMDERCFAGLQRFGSKIIGASSKELTRLWRDQIPEVAFSNPYLMHTLLAVAAAHERVHDMADDAPRTWSESYHTARATYLFNRKLSSHLTPADYDPLWATAALLGLLACTIIETTPENSWPLKPSSSDLEWLKLTYGKKVVWELTNLLRPSSLFSSVFESMAPQRATWEVPLPSAGVGSIDPRLASLCGITESSSAENNQHFQAAHALANLQSLISKSAQDSSGQPRKPKPEGLGRVSFLGQTQVQCLERLKRRDKVALVLLAMCYQQCEGICWWLRRRARVEGRAIRLYLKQRYPEDKILFELLPDPDDRENVSAAGPDVNGTL